MNARHSLEKGKSLCGIEQIEVEYLLYLSMLSISIYRLPIHPVIVSIYIVLEITLRCILFSSYRTIRRVTRLSQLPDYLKF